MSHEAIAEALRAMLGPAVGIGITDPADTIDDLWDAESAAMARAIPKRRCEFAAGRRAARAAMVDLGLLETAIPQGPDRAPIWPAGLTGSIAHCDQVCIAAVSQNHRSIGIDVEPATPLTDDLITRVCTAEEQAALPDQNSGLVAKQIFCTKEAVYKAQYPLTGQVIEFDALSIRLHTDGQFNVTLHHPLPTLPVLNGRVCRWQNMFLASIAICH